MALTFKSKPELLIKLTASSFMITVAAAKLCSFKMSLVNEIKKDIEYIKKLESAYILSADDDEQYAEKFAQLSFEVDSFMLERESCDEHK